MAVARPLHSNSLPSVDEQDTCPVNLSPIAKKLENRFALVARDDHESPVAKEEPVAGDKSRKVPEEKSLVALDGDESQKVPKEEPALVATAMAGDKNKQVPNEEPAAAIPANAEHPPVARKEDDVFFDATELSRNEQIAARDALKQCGGADADTDGDEDEDGGDDQPVLKKPAAKVKPAAALKAAICKDSEQEEDPAAKPVVEAKCKAKSTPKAKAKAKVTAEQDGDDTPAAKRKPGRPKKGAKAPDVGELESKPGPAVDAKDAKDAPAPAEDAPAETAAEPKKKKRRVKGEDGEKKTFASRPMPKVDVFAIQRFKAIREAYELLIAPKLRFRSSLEEYGLKTVQNNRMGHE